MAQLRIALAQSDSQVGDLKNNAKSITDFVSRAAQAGSQVVVFPEGCLTGYPVEDLAQRLSFVTATKQATDQLAMDLDALGFGGIHVIIGTLGTAGPDNKTTNRAAVLYGGVVTATYDKQHLPNYGVFDEYRIFAPGISPTIVEVAGKRLGLVICEDLWQSDGIAAQLGTVGVDAVIALNASPYEQGKAAMRQEVGRAGAAAANAPLFYVNAAGGQDDLVFDGGSFVVDQAGTLLARAPQFEEALIMLDIAPTGVVIPAKITPALDPDHEVYQALVVGLRSYAQKNGFKTVILGASGGIDSAFVAAVAADALGGENVYGVAMPSRYSSGHSVQDAEDLIKRLGGHYRLQPIAPMFDAFQGELALTGVSEENLQARVRGMILMGLSNQEGHLVLAPGNKSELAVGYSTIYGDAVGGFGPIKDVLKSRVWELSRWRNNYALDQGLIPPIPESSITKPPSAELRPDQVDQDSLPTKITSVAFGRDRRVPVTSAWREPK